MDKYHCKYGFSFSLVQFWTKHINFVSQQYKLLFALEEDEAVLHWNVFQFSFLPKNVWSWTHIMAKMVSFVLQFIFVQKNGIYMYQWSTDRGPNGTLDWADVKWVISIIIQNLTRNTQEVHTILIEMFFFFLLMEMLIRSWQEERCVIITIIK